MADLIAALLLLLTAVPPNDSGYTSAYAPTVMQHQVAYHGLSLDGLDGAIAVADCGRIGEIWQIRPEGSTAWHRVVVADCAGRNAYDEHGVSWMARRGVIAELSHELAVKFWGAYGVGCRIEVIRP